MAGGCRQAIVPMRLANFQDTLLLALPVAFLFSLPFVVLLFAFRETDSQLDFAALEMHVQRQHRVAGPFNAADQPAYLLLVQQELAGAHGVRLEMRGHRRQRTDMTADQIYFAV